MTNLQNYFGFKCEPFGSQLKLSDIHPLPGLKGFVERFTYAVRNRLVTVVTGDVGSGKSTSLRYAVSTLHPSECRILPVIATSGSRLELYRQLCMALGAASRSFSSAHLTATIRACLQDILAKHQTPVLVIDEAHLLRLDVFTQLHTLAQYGFDSESLLPIVFSGQMHLIDKLLYHTCRPLASRVMGKTLLQGLKRADMEAYLAHHLAIAGVSERLFSDEAITALHQGSGGLLRRAKHMARASLMAAAAENCHIVSAEHVRLASTEIL